MKIHAVGGYGLVGRNMSIYEFDKDAVAIDMGLHLDNYIAYQEAEPNAQFIDREMLGKIGAIPDLNPVQHIKHKVKAIILTHGHLDHIGGVQFLEDQFDAPIIGTPLTISILRTLIADRKSTKLKNRLISIKPGATYMISNELKVEFIKASHSIPDAAILAFHTPQGVYLHATDFKFDAHPGLGDRTDIKRLTELKGSVRSVVLDTLNADEERKTPSEKVAQEMLRDVLLSEELNGKGVIISTFSSHLARLKEIEEVGKKMGRKVVYIGRSLDKYMKAGEDANVTKFNSQIIGFSRKVAARLKQIEKEGKEKYLVVATGHQGEPGSILDRIARKDLKFALKPDDAIVFSCRVIPAPQNILNREKLDNTLRSEGVRLFTGVHVSGHLSQQDHRYFIELVKPEKVIPTHSDFKKAMDLMPVLKQLGYAHEDLVLLGEGDSTEIK
jgi:ribonuclease J